MMPSDQASETVTLSQFPKPYNHARKRSRDDQDLLLYTPVPAQAPGPGSHQRNAKELLLETFATPIPKENKERQTEESEVDPREEQLYLLTRKQQQRLAPKRSAQSSLADYISKSPLIRYASSYSPFWNRNKPKPQEPHKAGQHVLLLREDHVSLDQLNPAPSCSTRKSTAVVAMVNLIATVCGGGVLSLPLAFSRAGIIPTTILMLFGAVITDFALLCLVDSARKTGGRTYGDVAAAAFGSFSQVVTTLMVGLMLCGSLIAYQVLVKDIWTPVVFFIVSQIVAPSRPQGNDGSGIEPTARQADILLASILVMASPLLLKKELHALRHTCYVGFGSCVLLMVAVIYRACEKLSQVPHTVNLHKTLNWWTDDSADILFAFPIVILCYFCSYNVLAVHSQMVQPTRPRIRIILGLSMAVCCVLFLAVGLCGYLYTYDTTTPDNILLAFDLSDKAILAGRMGFCLTLLFGLPLVLLPCREALVSVPDQWRAWRRDVQLVAQFQKLNETYEKMHPQSPYPRPFSENNNDYGATSTTKASTYKMTKVNPHLVINGVDFDGLAPTLISKDPENRHGVSILLPVPVNGDNSVTMSTVLSKGEDTNTTVLSSEAYDEEYGFRGAHPLLGDEEDHGDSPHQQMSNMASQPIPSSQPQRHPTLQHHNARPMVQITIQPNAQDHCCTTSTSDPDSTSFLYHAVATALILAPTFVVAIVVPGVASVWSIVGSSMAIWIAFVVPTACFLQIRQHKGLTTQALYAWLLLLFALVAMVLCTKQAILNVVTASS